MDIFTLEKMLVETEKQNSLEGLRILLIGRENGWVFEEYITKCSYPNATSTKSDRDNN